MSTTMYHNPKCSKCRLTLQLLEDNQVTTDVVEYLTTPPDAKTLGNILKMPGIEPRDLMRKHEPEYRALNLDSPDLGRDELIQAMLENPILIERPIVIKDGKAAIGRPPENVLEIL